PAEIAAFANDVCCVCLSSVRTPARSRVLRCGHVFHAKCISQWLQQRPSCPLC
ncbi:hypothetical protein T492DRAFT_567594, partial [Pavlovales sp. CCMP2436]